MLSLGELAGTGSILSLRGKLVLHSHQGGASTNSGVSGVGGPGEQTSACTSALPGSNICPGCCMCKTTEGSWGL